MIALPLTRKGRSKEQKIILFKDYQRNSNLVQISLFDNLNCSTTKQMLNTRQVVKVVYSPNEIKTPLLLFQT